MEQTKTKYPAIVVKISESGPLGYSKQLPSPVIKTFRDDKWSGFKPAHDILLEDAEITIEDNKIIITGTQKLFHTTFFGRKNYGKKYELFDEYDEDGRMTIEEVQRLIAHHSVGKLKVSNSDIKLFYVGFWNFIKRKKTYYLDTTPEVISALNHIAIHEIKKDRKGYYVDGWYQTTLTKPYRMETNNYRLENH